MTDDNKEKIVSKLFCKNYAKLLKDAIVSRIQRSDFLVDCEKSYIESIIESEYTEILKIQIDDIEKEYDILLDDLKK